ncbi:polyadenylate-binding protein [Mucidula mucida]|nr:polyadenylate-binding protein [Mucidula mucida]
MNPMGMGGPAEAPRRAHLYVGNLSPRVTEYMLTEIFAVAGPVQHVKIIPDRNYQHGGLNYGFVEYMDMRAAETALQTLNGRKIFDTEIRVNWAYQGQQNKEDTTGHYHVFVGDLSPEVNDEVLAKAFSAFGTMSDARVMWDMNSGKSRGYGFLAFRDKTDAEQAIATMNGEWLGSRAIRVNWANQKTQGAPPSGGIGGGNMGPVPTTVSPRPGAVGTAPAPINFSGGPLSYEAVVQQTPAYNTTVYVGNLVPYCTQADLIPLFQSIGYLSEIRMQADRGFAFVKLDTHEHAALAIVQLQGQMVHGRSIKCSWGKDRADAGAAQPISPTTAPASPYGNMPMYGMPQPASYSQYPYNGYAGGPGSPGMPQAATGSTALGLTGAQQSTDPSAAGQAGAAQWGGDPSAYYSNYWAGKWYHDSA